MSAHDTSSAAAGATEVPVSVARAGSGQSCAVRSDLAYLRCGIVNVMLFGEAGSPGGWVLIDTGLPGSRGSILRAAEQRFGSSAPPAAILLTHGHFDHVGTVRKLAAEWDVPVYAHKLEQPYLDGSAAYPPPDPFVGGGLMSLLSPLFPRSPIDLGHRLQALPEDGSVPFMPGWRWLHTPGHAPGHVSFWRESDRVLISGDAIITTRQESVYAVATQKPVIHGPPRYFTIDWERSAESAARLRDLKPELLVSGHGPAMSGGALISGLDRMVAAFRETEMPARGKYVRHPARSDDGSAYRRKSG